MGNIRHLRILHHPSIVNLIIHISPIVIVLVPSIHVVLVKPTVEWYHTLGHWVERIHVAMVKILGNGRINHLIWLIHSALIWIIHSVSRSHWMTALAVKRGIILTLIRKVPIWHMWVERRGCSWNTRQERLRWILLTFCTFIFLSAH